MREEDCPDKMECSIFGRLIAAPTEIPKEDGTCSQVMSGRLRIRLPGRPPLAVVLKVHKTTCEHFAVVYPDRRSSLPAQFSSPGSWDPCVRPIGYINLRSCSISTLLDECAFTVTQSHCDPARPVTFICDTESDLQLWLSAMRHERILVKRHSLALTCSLPSVTEES